MDFPAAEKCYSHVSTRRPSDSSESESSPSSSTIQSPAKVRPALFTLDSYDHGLTAQPSSATARPQITRELTITKTTTAGITITLEPGYEVDFEGEDPEDPRNWPL